MPTTKIKPAAHTPRKDSMKPVKVKAIKKESKAHVPEKQVTEKSSGLSASLFGVDGKATGHVTLPEQLFGAKVNKNLLAQSVRVYLANQREGSANTKTRGEVEGSTRKIYRQKGTGRARHGGIRAPIFVGGGIVFGPKPRGYHLGLSKVMKQKALAAALSMKLQEKSVFIIDGMEAVESKTKKVSTIISSLVPTGSVLLAVSSDAVNLVRAARNLSNVVVVRAIDLYPYTIISHAKLIMTKKGLDEAKTCFIN